MDGQPKRSPSDPKRRRLQFWIFLIAGAWMLATLAVSAYVGAQRGGRLPAVRIGLQSVWSFRSSTGTEAVDSVGAAAGRILDPVWVEGRGYLALQFDGQSSVVEIPDLSLGSSDGSFTVCCWIRPDSTRDRQILLVVLGGPDEDLRVAPVAVYVPWGQGRVGLVLYNGDRRVGFLSDETILRNQWQHVAVSLNGTSGRLRFYIDGELAEDRQTTVIPLASQHSLPARIGAESIRLPGRFGLQADLDSVSLYRRELEPEEIQRLAVAPQ